MKNKYKEFKDDKKTPRCQGDVYHSGGVYGGPALGSAGYHQCSISAKYDKNTRCKVHSKAGAAKRRKARIAREVTKAKATLTMWGAK